MNTIELFVPIKPVPASRPIVGRWGTHYTKNYTDFRNEMYTYLNKLKEKYPANKSCYKVHIDFIMKKPKSPANEYPVSDLDNLEKGVLDALVKCSLFFIDDIQIIKLSSFKRYQRRNEPYGMHIVVTEYTKDQASELLN